MSEHQQLLVAGAGRVVIGDWKHDYTHHRRHSALGYLPPAVYAAVCMHRGDAHAIGPACSAHDQYVAPNTGCYPGARRYHLRGSTTKTETR